MKTIGIILIAILLINASFKPAQDAAKVKVYDYVYIVGTPVINGSLKTVTVNGTDGTYKQIDVKSKAEGELDVRELFKFITIYEKNGYEVFSTFSTSYVMRKEHTN